MGPVERDSPPAREARATGPEPGEGRSLCIAILGGGQLGRMMALAGTPLGLEFLFLDPSADACASAVGKVIRAGYDDAGALDEIATLADIASFDFENVPEASAERLAGRMPFHPSPRALGFSQDRLREKQLLAELGIPVPRYHAVDKRPDLLDGLDALGYPAMLKTRRLGYDGKGQAVLREAEDLERAWQLLGGRALVVEEFVPFELECSLIAVSAGPGGATASWPLTRNVHDGGVLALSRAGGFPPDLQQKAEDYAARLLKYFGYRGVLTVEFFLREGELLVNEIAPRVHNSGHWTVDGAVTSQFENHLRGICGWPLGGTEMLAESLMFNWIGELPDRAAMLAVPGLHWHDYGKAPRPRRKLGHATVTAPDAATLEERAHRVADLAGPRYVRELEALLG